MKRETKLLKHVFLKVSEALAFAHKREVIHLDVRPSNIIVCSKEWGIEGYAQ